MFLQGGGLCVEPVDCLQRAKTYRGSSKFWAPTHQDDSNVLSGDTTFNPFANWSHIYGERPRHQFRYVATLSFCVCTETAVISVVHSRSQLIQLSTVCCLLLLMKVCAVVPYSVCCSALQCMLHTLQCAAVPYSSGDVWIGVQKSANLMGLHFAGHNTLEAMVHTLLNTTAFGSAKRVLLSGASAGGIGTFQNADWLHQVRLLLLTTP